MQEMILIKSDSVREWLGMNKMLWANTTQYATDINSNVACTIESYFNLRLAPWPFVPDTFSGATGDEECRFRDWGADNIWPKYLSMWCDGNMLYGNHSILIPSDSESKVDSKKLDSIVEHSNLLDQFNAAAEQLSQLKIIGLDVSYEGNMWAFMFDRSLDKMARKWANNLMATSKNPP